LGDHWETINPDRPDTHSAFGNPDSHFFYSVKGNDEPEGGGGQNGVGSLEDVNRNGGGRRLMVKKHGGSVATENAVDLALQWLAYHQELDGHWNSEKYQGMK